jgi:hypothetical protein
MLAITSIRRAITASAICIAAVVVSTGCTASLTATPARARVLYDYPVVYVDSAPTRVYASPRVYYRGRPAYLVDSRWYYPVDGGWVYFAEEPLELRRSRVQRQYTRAAPREARHYAERPPRYVEPRRRYVEPPRQSRRRRYD